MATQPGIGKENPLNQIVSSGLKATAPGSLIGASLKFDSEAFSPRGEVATKLQGGNELRIRQRDEHVYAEILEDGKVMSANPSGVFRLADGKTMEIEEGRIVGGTTHGPEAWLMFALLTDFPGEAGEL